MFTVQYTIIAVLMGMYHVLIMIYISRDGFVAGV